MALQLPPSILLLLQQAQRGVGQINTRGTAVSSALMPFAGRAQQNYAPMLAQEQSLGNALNQSQASTGSSLGAGIGAALSGIQAPGQAVSQYAGGTATTGAQAGAAIGALSSADLERLHGSSTAEQIYAAALPRLAALASDQERRGFLQQQAQQLSDLSLQEASAQQQRSIDDYKFRYQVQQDALDRKAAAKKDKYARRQDAFARREQLRKDKAQAKRDKFAYGLASSKFGLDVSKEQRYQGQAAETARAHRASEAHQRAEESLAQQRIGESDYQFQARERRYRQQFNARMRATAQRGFQPNASLSAKYGFIVDGHGKPILTKNGKKIPVRSDSKSSTSHLPPWAQPKTKPKPKK